jgi:hypothetical protein
MTQLGFLLFLFPQVHGKMLRSSRRSHWSLKGERDSLLRQTLKKKLIFSLKKKKEKSKKGRWYFFFFLVFHAREHYQETRHFLGCLTQKIIIFLRVSLFSFLFFTLSPSPRERLSRRATLLTLAHQQQQQPQQRWWWFYLAILFFFSSFLGGWRLFKGGGTVVEVVSRPVKLDRDTS